MKTPNVPESAPPGEDEPLSHDKILRTLGHQFLSDLVEIIYPEVADEIDFSSAKFVAGKLFADFRKEGHVEPDVVAELRAKNGDRQVVLFHAEMENRHLVEFERRLRIYNLQLSLEYPDSAILTAAIYRLGGPKQGIAKREVVTEFRGVVTNRFYYVALSLSQSLAEEYVDRPQALAAALAALMRSKIWDRVEQKIRCYEAIRRAEVDEEKRYILVNTVDNYLPLSENDKARFDIETRSGEHKEVETMIQTFSEALAAREARGEALGEARGKLLATRQAIVLLARSMHGGLPDGFTEKLDLIDDLGRLYEVLELVPKVNKLEEIFP